MKVLSDHLKSSYLGSVLASSRVTSVTAHCLLKPSGATINSCRSPRIKAPTGWDSACKSPGFWCWGFRLRASRGLSPMRKCFASLASTAGGSVAVRGGLSAANPSICLPANIVLATAWRREFCSSRVTSFFPGLARMAHGAFRPPAAPRHRESAG
jgi:hypothetical protein